MPKVKINSYSVRDTLNIGRAIARNIKKGDIICLYGQLGCGKTVLTKGIALGLGFKQNNVISPTFVLIREYKTKIPMYHFDLYRINCPEDILILGYEEYFYNDGVSIIEWADRLKYLLPKECLKIKMSLKSGRQRVLEFTACGRRAKSLLKGIDENIRH